MANHLNENQQKYVDYKHHGQHIRPIGGECFGYDKVGAEKILIKSTNHTDITLSLEAWDNYVKSPYIKME
jgi:hypothetical protein